MGDPQRPSSRSLADLEPVGAILLIGWRLAVDPLSVLWRDAVLLIGVYWLCAIVVSKSRILPILATTIMAFLLGVYVYGQAPHILSVVGLRP